MKDTRMDKELLWALEANGKTIAHAVSRIELYSGEINDVVSANLKIYMELFYRRQPYDRPKEE